MLTGNGKQIFMIAFFAFDTGKAVVSITVIQMSLKNLINIRTSESVLP
jgi:hypothetical protein